MIQPKISVIMPLYNVGKLVEKAVRSLKHQSLTEWELIIVNDGSTDNSRDIALVEAYGDSRIRIVDKLNGGLSDARNFGIPLARGEYIHFFDSDDYVSIDYYKEMYNTAQSVRADIVISGYSIDSYSKNGNYVEGKKEIIVNWSSAIGLSNFISGYFNFAWNKLFKREFVCSNNLYFEFGLKLIEDCEFMSRVIQFNPMIAYCRDCGYHYRNDSRKTLSRFFDKSLIFNSGRRIMCTSLIIKFLSFDKSINEGALDITRFNCVRFLIHSLFAFTDGLTFNQKRMIVKEIFANNNLRVQTFPSHSLTKSEVILWKLVKNRHYNLLAALYQIKER